jgi:hypothetical protein
MNKKFLIIFVSILVLIIFFGTIQLLNYSRQEKMEVVIEQRANEIIPQASEPVGEVIASESIFDITDAKVGDVVAGMKIVSIEPFTPGAKIEDDSAIVKFSGKVTITGNYIYNNEDAAFIYGEVCMENLDPISISNIPRVHPHRNVWFCFRNKEYAQSLFKPQGSYGTTTVVIDNYQVNELGAEIWNTAELVEVIKKN